MTITGLILAGGRGTRMEHADKGLQAFTGMPLVQHVLTRLKPQVNQLIINANRNLDRYQRFEEPVWSDTMPDFAGPLAGLQTGLLHCSTPLLASVPCDSPFLPLDLVECLHAALIASDAELAVVATGNGDERRSHPVFCLMKTTLLPHLTAYLLNGGRKVSTWQATRKMIEVHFDDETAFRNINSHDDLHRFEATAK
jgi:molybdopterin-guanine dinucleotide biosynthesis protein A